MSTALVIQAREIEERVLRFLEQVVAAGEADPRWLASGKTDVEKGFMAIIRSLEKPGRTILPVERQTDETAWVIEYGGSPVSEPQYFCGGMATWTFDHNDACRFARMKDADRTAYMFAGDNYRIAEHAWS